MPPDDTDTKLPDLPDDEQHPDRDNPDKIPPLGDVLETTSDIFITDELEQHVEGNWSWYEYHHTKLHFAIDPADSDGTGVTSDTFLSLKQMR